MQRALILLGGYGAGALGLAALVVVLPVVRRYYDVQPRTGVFLALVALLVVSLPFGAHIHVFARPVAGSLILTFATMLLAACVYVSFFSVGLLLMPSVLLGLLAAWPASGLPGTRKEKRL